MFIEDWNSFYDQAESLYKNDPLKTRYVLKYIHKSRKLVLKVTDDKVCLQYQTDQQPDVKKVEKLNNLFFGFMAKGVEESAEPAVDGDTEMAEAAQSAEPASNHVAGNSHKRQEAPQQSRSKQRGTKTRRT